MATAADAVRILVVDDEPLLREGVERALSADAGFEIVGGAGSVAEALDAVERLRPDVMLVDYRLPGPDGTQLCERVSAAHPGVRILVLTRFTKERILLEMFDAGAHGYLVKATDPVALREAVRVVASGEVHIDPAMGDRLVKKVLEGQPVRHAYHLTARELHTVRLVCEGLTNPEIAERLGVSVSTVKTHLKHAMRKMGVEGRFSLAETAHRQGIVREGGS